jgi:hypothetical protein
MSKCLSKCLAPDVFQGAMSKCLSKCLAPDVFQGAMSKCLTPVVQGAVEMPGQTPRMHATDAD